MRTEPSMRHTLVLQPARKLAGQITRAVIAQEARFVINPHLRQSCILQSVMQCVCHIFRRHRCAQTPRQNISGIVIQHGREIIPAPADDLKIGKIRLP